MAKRAIAKNRRDPAGFLAASPTAFHAVATMAAHLSGAGYDRLEENARWRLQKNHGYFVERNGSAIAAFFIGDGAIARHGVRIIAAHTDFPCFKIKPGQCTITGDGYIRLNTETYGGAILPSWLDRPLSLAGRVMVKNGDPFRPEARLVDFARPLAIIPGVAIHFNRAVNEGYAYNKQIDMQPLFGLATADNDRDCLSPLVAQELGVPVASLLDWELYLYDCSPGTTLGLNNEFFSAPRLDNLSMVYAGLRGLLESREFGGIRMLAAFDNEEVGSGTMQGADSFFLPGLLDRIFTNLKMDSEDANRALANSIAISGDVAHAVHPNHPDKHDPTNRPMLGGGPVIKYSAAQKYVTNAFSASVFKQVCALADVPVQSYVNRSDMPGGSTIGPAMSSMCSLQTVDVGIPILAMHSARELTAMVDFEWTTTAFAEFFGGK